MALSQIQCFDDNHVNPRIHEAKPEFFYCEEQRLALEALFQDGRDAFVKYLESRGLRGFLSDLELETLTAALEPFDPHSELFSGEAEDEPEPLSLQYWPEVSDTSIPQMDLGWPNSDSYRGVTRTSVYTQPPMEGQAHIKEVVRKMIAQAQKMIAVVMDVFTDVDIFRDLLDAGFKRKVSVYILLERTMLPHFLSMCRRASMHAGHLKHLRVRCTDGTEFYTRYSTKVRGQMGHRFMFIDGDKAVSGSYSFTWRSSRLDRNLITVITGQGVDTFDQLFRFLYTSSSFVELRQVATAPEPEPDTRHQVLSVAPPSAAIARKLYNPKYALVALSSPSPVNSNGHDSPKEPEISEDPKNKKKQKRIHEELPQNAPPLHPGLINLEKANLISYLPIWPEPDPPRDVIGFINIRDSKKTAQAHLQRSEMFETSQAIKFSCPISNPQETLPEVAMPRKLTAQSESKTENLLVDKAKPEQKSVGLVGNNITTVAPEQSSPLYRQKLNSDKDETKVVRTENKLCSNMTTSPDSGLLDLSPQALPQSSIKALTPKNEQPPHEAQIVSTTTLSEPLILSKSVKEPEILNFLKIQCTFMDETNTQESNAAQKSQMQKLTQLNTEDTEEKTTVSQQDSHTNTVNMQVKISSEETRNLQYPSRPVHIATYSASTTVPSTTADSSCNSRPSTSSPSILSHSTSSFPALPLLPSSVSSCKSSVALDSKPHTDQLFKQDSIDSKTVPDISLVKRSETSLGQQIVDDVSALASVVQTSPVKHLESAQELHKNSVSKTGDQKHTENTNIPKDAKQETETVISQETKSKEADEKHNGRRDVQSITAIQVETKSNVSIKDAPKTAVVNINEILPKNVDSMTYRDSVTGVTTDTRKSDKTLTNPEFELTNMIQTYLARCHEPQIISYSNFTLQEINLVKALDSLTAPVNCISHNTYVPKDKHCDSIKSAENGLSPSSEQAQVPSPDCSDITSNSIKQLTNTFQDQACKTQAFAHTSKKTLHLHLSNVHVTDLTSQTTRKESELPAAVVQTPTPKGILPTPDSRTTSPDPRTPTPDYSDGYFSPREDSALSTPSEEYFECIESPSHEPVLDTSGYRNHGIRENDSIAYSGSPFSKDIGTSPADLDNIPSAAALDSASQSISCNESSTLAWTAEDPSASLRGTKGQNRGSKVTNKRNSKEAAKIEVKSSDTGKKKAPEYQSKEGTDNKEFNQMPGPLKNDSDLREINLKLSKASGRLVDGGMTDGESTQKEPNRLSTGEPKPERVLSEGKKTPSGIEKPLNQAAPTPSNMEIRQRQPTRETTGHKSLHPSPKSQPRQQPGSRGSSPSRPLKSSRPLSGSQVQRACPSGIRDLNQTESMALPSNLKLSDNKPPSRRSQSRSPSPMKVVPIGAASGRKQVSQSQPRQLARQPPAAQIRSKPDYQQSQTTKPQCSNLKPRVHTHASTEEVSEQAAHELEEARGPFNLSFGRFYNFKGLRDKWTKLPTQSKRSSTGTPVKERKSTS
ncbi:hypothetical protein GOODEAATRI_012685 [Goodea atripinnis]|uniref:Scaffolding anchor of CK1 domain-containing protein n=1 Tax=Goodea atripinnis TaxID=208336 RepID=A0ABV0N0Y9_9TELE